MELCTKNIVAAIVSSYPANDSEVLTVEAWKCVSHHEYVRQTMVTKGWANQILNSKSQKIVDLFCFQALLGNIPKMPVVGGRFMRLHMM